MDSNGLMILLNYQVVEGTMLNLKTRKVTEKSMGADNTMNKYEYA